MNKIIAILISVLLLTCCRHKYDIPVCSVTEDRVAFQDGFEESDSVILSGLADAYGADQIYLVFHTDATYKGREFEGPDEINQFFKNHYGWRSPGYIEWLDRDCEWHQLKSFNIDCVIEPWEISNGARGYNTIAVHLAYSSSLRMWNTGDDTRTDCMKDAIADRVKLYKSICPNVKVIGHRDLSPDLNGDGIITSNEFTKTCPNFDVAKEYKHLLE